MEYIKLNDGIEIPAIGFDCSAKSDMDLFTIRNGASLELWQAKITGENRKFVIPDNANNTSLTTKYVDFDGISIYYNKANPCISISKKANNTTLDFCWTNFNGECTSRIQNDGKNTKISEWYVSAAGKKRFAATSTGEPDDRS